MFKKIVSSFVIISFFLMDAASCMTNDNEEPEEGGRHAFTSLSKQEDDEKKEPSKTPSSLQDVQTRYEQSDDPQEKLNIINNLPYDLQGQQLRKKFSLELAMGEKYPKEIRLNVLHNISSYTYLMDVTARTHLDHVILGFLNDEKISLQERVSLLVSLKEAPPIPTLLNLMQILEEENVDEFDYINEYNVTGLIKFAATCSDSKITKRVENFFLKHSKLKLEIINRLPYDEAGNQLRLKYLLELVVNEETPHDVRIDALSRISQFVYLIHDEAIRTQLVHIVLPLLDDEQIPLQQRVGLLPTLKEAPPTTTLLNLMQVLEDADIDIKQFNLTPGFVFLLKFIMANSDLKIQEGVESFFLKHPKLFVQFFLTNGSVLSLKRVRNLRKTYS